VIRARHLAVAACLALCACGGEPAAKEEVPASSAEAALDEAGEGGNWGIIAPEEGEDSAGAGQGRPSASASPNVQPGRVPQPGDIPTLDGRIPNLDDRDRIERTGLQPLGGPQSPRSSRNQPDPMMALPPEAMSGGGAQ
jgi:hypothetical protein